MANVPAYSAVRSLLNFLDDNGPLTRQLKIMRDNLADAMNAEAAVAELRAQIDPLKSQLAAVQADLKLAQEQYVSRQGQIKDSLSALQVVYAEQEKAQQDRIKAYEAQASEVERTRDAAREAAEKHMREAQVASGKKREELEKEYGARKMQLDLEEQAVRSRLEEAKTEFSILLKRMTG